MIKSNHPEIFFKQQRQISKSRILDPLWIYCRSWVFTDLSQIKAAVCFIWWACQRIRRCWKPLYTRQFMNWPRSDWPRSFQHSVRVQWREVKQSIHWYAPLYPCLLSCRWCKTHRRYQIPVNNPSPLKVKLCADFPIYMISHVEITKTKTHTPPTHPQHSPWVMWLCLLSWVSSGFPSLQPLTSSCSLQLYWPL